MMEGGEGGRVVDDVVVHRRPEALRRLRWLAVCVGDWREREGWEREREGREAGSPRTPPWPQTCLLPASVVVVMP